MLGVGMKSMIAGALVCLAVATAFGDDYRTFTDTEGRSIKAEIVEFNPSTGKLLIKREDGKQVWVSPSIFCENDRNYIRSWAQSRKIVSEKALQVTVELIKDDDASSKTVYETSAKHERGRCSGTVKGHVAAKVVLKNLTDAPIQGLSIEYRFLVGIADAREDEVAYRVPGLISGVSLGPRESKELETDAIPLVQHWIWGTVATDERGDDGKFLTEDRDLKCGADYPKGIWLKLCGSGTDGVSVVRDVCVPEGLDESVFWDDWAPDGPKSAKVGPDSLEAYRLRGTADSPSQYKRWMDQLFAGNLYRADANEVDLRQAGMKVFYEPDNDPDGIWAMRMAGYCRDHSLYPAAVHWYAVAIPLMSSGKRHVENKTNITRMMAKLSEIYSSAPDENVWDGAKAIKYAQAALEQDKKNDERFELLARAYARNGQFDLAVKTQKEAIERLQKTRKDEDDLAAYQKRLELYQNEQPYTEPEK